MNYDALALAVFAVVIASIIVYFTLQNIWSVIKQYYWWYRKSDVQKLEDKIAQLEQQVHYYKTYFMFPDKQVPLLTSSNKDLEEIVTRGPFIDDAGKQWIQLWHKEDWAAHTAEKILVRRKMRKGWKFLWVDAVYKGDEQINYLDKNTPREWLPFVLEQYYAKKEPIQLSLAEYAKKGVKKGI